MLKSRVLGAAAALTLGLVPAAHAADLFNGVYCGGTDFQTCASVQVSYIDQGGGVFDITMVVGNQGTLGEIYNAAGLWGLPAGGGGNLFAGASNGNYSGPAGTAYGFQTSDVNQLVGSGATNDVAGFAADPPPTDNGLANGQTGTFTFTLSGLTLAQLQSAGVSIRGIGVNFQGQDCSTRLVISPGGGTNNAGPFPCGVVVPEPLSMTLLATGLAGMGGVGFLRRRKNNGDVA